MQFLLRRNGGCRTAQVDVASDVEVVVRLQEIDNEEVGINAVIYYIAIVFLITTAVTMEDKPIVISHCASDILKKKSLKWDVLSRSGLSQYFGVDHSNQFLAVYQAPSVIELWDISSSPVALASLSIPISFSQEQTSVEDVCQCMVWSHCRDYLFTVFGAQNRPIVSDISSDRKGNSTIFYLWNISTAIIINSLRCNLLGICLLFRPNR